MRYLIGLIFGALTVLLCWMLDGKRTDALPLAMGRFLDPFGGFWQNAESENEYGDLELSMEGLQAPVQVVYDERRVPHIFAQNDQDLYFAQGFVTARDRLWQMEFQVMAAGGRLSEIIDNPKVLRLDREKRRLGIPEAARRAEELYQQSELGKSLMGAYRDGVNAYISSLSPAEYPLEYKLLDYAPEPWTNLKTTTLLKMMAWNLTGRSRDFEYSNTLVTAGWEKFNELLPATHDSLAPIIPLTHEWGFDSVYVPPKPTDSIPVAIINNLSLTQPDPANGSNNWAVHGSKTKSGNPILCNDPHLGLSFPSIWYEIHLHTPEHSVYGVSLPGSPTVIIGFNEDIAWGVTNASRDVQDWYQIEFKDNSRKEYRYGDKWLPVEEVIEEIKLRNGDVVKDTVLWTIHGPVVYDRNFGDTSKVRPLNLAMRWMAHDTSLEAMTFYKMNRGKSHADYRDALVHFSCPGQNFVFASKSGDVAITQSGRYPNKWEGQGQFIMDGSNPEHAWQGLIPFEHNPHVKNPPRGFVHSANQHATGPSYPYDIHGYYDHTRSRRIKQALSGMSNVTVEDMMALQQDSYNQLAGEALERMLNQVEVDQLGAPGKMAFDALKTWTKVHEEDMVAPIYFRIWSSEISPARWEPELDRPSRPAWVPPSYLAIHNLLATAEDSTTDASEVKRIKALFTATLETAGAEGETWKNDNPDLEFKWANWNNARVIHLSRQKAFSHFRLPTGGDGSVVNAVRGNHGPSWRMIVEMGPEPIAYGMFPGGPSGNPGSYWYDNQIPDWTEGRYKRLHLYKSPEEAQKTATSTLKLNKH